MNPACIYARYSPRPKSKRDVLSIETQLKFCREYAAAHGFTIVAEYTDAGLSGGTDERPGFQRAVAHACRAHAALIVYSLSRFSRSVQDGLEYAQRLRDAHADLISLHESLDSTTPNGRLMFTILAAVAAWEREVTAERTSEAMLSHQAGGRRMGSICPFGWVGDAAAPGRMLRDADEQAVIERIVALSMVDPSTRGVARCLNTAGYRNRGHPFTGKSVERILARARSSVA